MAVSKDQAWITLCAKLENTIGDRIDYLKFPLEVYIPKGQWRAFPLATPVTGALNYLKDTKDKVGLAYFKEVLLQRGELVSLKLISESACADFFVV